jgi:thymidylate synthase
MKSNYSWIKLRITVILGFLFLLNEVVAQNINKKDTTKTSDISIINSDTNFNFKKTIRKNLDNKLPEYKLNDKEIKDAKYIQATKNTNYYKRNSPSVKKQ